MKFVLTMKDREIVGFEISLRLYAISFVREQVLEFILLFEPYKIHGRIIGLLSHACVGIPYGT